MFGKKNIASVVAEFLGSGILTLVVIGVQHSTIGVPYFVGLAAGLAATVLIFMFGAASGAQLNPAITLALWSVRQVRTVRAILFIAAQLLGAWLAYYLFTYHINTKLTPVSSAFNAHVLVAEAVGTAVLAFAWGAATYRRYVGSTQAAVVGLGYALGIVIASAASIGLINPAVALADRAWVWGTYVLGPVLGAVIGMNLYLLLFTDEVNAVQSAVLSRTKTTVATNDAVITKTTTVKSTPRKTAAKRKTTTRRK